MADNGIRDPPAAEGAHPGDSRRRLLMRSHGLAGIPLVFKTISGHGDGNCKLDVPRAAFGVEYVTLQKIEVQIL
jgi:hypothetical protein